MALLYDSNSLDCYRAKQKYQHKGEENWRCFC